MAPSRTMSVQDRMSRRVSTVHPEARLGEAARLMRQRKIRHVPVVDRDGRLLGMVTARDLRQAIFAPAVHDEREDLRSLLEALSVADVMTRGVLSVRPGTSIRDAARVMHERKVGALPVVAHERLVGILTETDVLRAFQELLGPATSAVMPASPGAATPDGAERARPARRRRRGRRPAPPAP
jgi:acetoin utilization protein AcuB